MVMVEKWRGHPADEEAFHRDAPPDGHTLGRATTIGNCKVVDSIDRRDVDIGLLQENLAMVWVSGPAWVSWLTGSGLALRSRHGRLCAAGRYGRPLHSIVPTRRLADGYHALDPWFSANGQPIEIDDDAFEGVWAGQALLFGS